MATQPATKPGEALLQKPLSQWVADTGRFDPDAEARLRALLGDFFEAGDRVSHRMMHLIWIAVDLVTTHIYPYGARNHIVGALDHGSSPEQIIEIFEIVCTVADRSVDIAFPIVIEEARSAGLAVPDSGRSAEDVAIKAAVEAKLGFVPEWIDLALRAAPEFTRRYLALGHAPAKPGALTAHDRALIYVALYSSPALIEPPVLRQHVRQAIREGATTQTLLDVVQLASGIGLHSFTTGVPILAECLDG